MRKFVKYILNIPFAAHGGCSLCMKRNAVFALSTSLFFRIILPDSFTNRQSNGSTTFYC